VSLNPSHAISRTNEFISCAKVVRTNRDSSTREPASGRFPSAANIASHRDASNPIPRAGEIVRTLNGVRGAPAKRGRCGWCRSKWPEASICVRCSTCPDCCRCGRVA